MGRHLLSCPMTMSLSSSRTHSSCDSTRGSGAHGSFGGGSEGREGREGGRTRIMSSSCESPAPSQVAWPNQRTMTVPERGQQGAVRARAGWPSPNPTNQRIIAAGRPLALRTAPHTHLLCLELPCLSIFDGSSSLLCSAPPCPSPPLLLRAALSPHHGRTLTAQTNCAIYTLNIGL